jgi:hypothetical protein
MKQVAVSTVLWLLSLATLVSTGNSVCHSYATRCQAVVGKSLVPDESSTDDVFDVPGTDALYFTYSVGKYSCRICCDYNGTIMLVILNDVACFSLTAT